jgi:aryl-alcohol dehydrogenase-like predicted oxidoreductase
MEYVQLGDSSIKVSVITAGVWAVGADECGGIDRELAIKSIHTAYELGCTSIDTAPCYGIGLSEQVVGEAIKTLPREKLQIFTKCGLVWEGTEGTLYLPGENYNGRVVDFYKYAGKESIIKQCEESLKRLNTDYIDLYSIHWPDVTTPIEESMEAMNLLIQQGKIRAAGVCNHDVNDMRRAEKVISVAANKVRYSMLNRGIEKELIPYCIEHNKTILAYSILQRGILTGENVPKFLWKVGDNPLEVALYEPENMELIKKFLDKLRPIAQDYGATLSQLGIRWTLDQPGINVVLLGATSVDNVKHDVKSLDLSLSQSDKNTINNLLEELEEELTLVPAH